MNKLTNRNKISPWDWVSRAYLATSPPLIPIMTLSIVLYKQLGLSNAEITLYTGWLYLPWILKPFLKSVIDLTKNKQLWLVSSELLIGASFGGIAFSIPTPYWLQGTFFFLWLLVFSRVFHNTTTNRFHTDVLNKRKQVWFASICNIFYQLATIFGQGILVMIVGNLQIIYRNNISLSWSLMFYAVAGLFIVLWLFAILPNKIRNITYPIQAKNIMEYTCDKVYLFIREINIREVFIMFLLLLLYRIPEALLSKISTLFLIDAIHNGGLGLSPQEFGFTQGTVGIVAFVLGSVLGRFSISHSKFKKQLIPITCTLILPNIVYVYLSQNLPSDFITINAFIFISQISYGFGFTAFIFYLIHYKQDNISSYRQTFFTSFLLLSIMLPSMFSGVIQELTDYKTFFLITLYCCPLPLIIAFLLKKYIFHFLNNP